MKPAFALLLALTLVILSGCSPPAATPSSPVSPSPTPTTAPSPAAATPEDVGAARQVVLDYWDALNSYDAERALSYLEESYRQERIESLNSDIGRMQSFNIKLRVEEEAEPVITSEGKVEIKMKVSTPIGAKHITYYLVKINDEWKIYNSVEE